jgi:hypothetical protein
METAREGNQYQPDENDRKIDEQRGRPMSQSQKGDNMSVEMGFDLDESTLRLAVPSLNGRDFQIRQRLAALPGKEYWEAMSNPATCVLLEELSAATCQADSDLATLRVIEALETIVGRLERRLLRGKNRS